MRPTHIPSHWISHMALILSLVAQTACGPKELPSPATDTSSDVTAQLDAASDAEAGAHDADGGALDGTIVPVDDIASADAADASIPPDPCLDCHHEDQCRDKPCVPGSYTCNVTPVCDPYKGACTCVNGKFSCTYTDCPVEDAGDTNADAGGAPDTTADADTNDTGQGAQTVPADCTELVAVYEAELGTIRACTADAECGQVLKGTSCGCTHNLVATKSADVSFFLKLLQAGTSKGCPGMGTISTCDCPAAVGFKCKSGVCTWNYK